MDEGFDASTGTDSLDVETSSDVPASESMDISIEPLADIPVEESATDSLNDTEPPISEQEMSELQNEAASLEIEPLDDGNNDDYFEIEGENTHSLGERIAAGAFALGAPFAAGVEAAAQAENINTGIPNDVPAIYAETDALQTPEQVIEQYQQDGWVISDGTKESQPSALQTAGELAGNYLDIAEAVAEGGRREGEAEGIKELTSALRKPEQSEFEDTE
ncbi:MAG: hypothetical protein LBQ69_06750 [Treponema sp.]|jgi:hypothetical protein|nr:hypothetical protein [Treponema sp.]